MKNIFKIIALLVLVYSCDDKCIESNVAIVNNSGKDVEISSYKKVGLDGKTIVFSKKINILNNERNETKTKDCGAGAGRGSIRALIEGDSIVIDYGDRIKSYGYSTTPLNRNPFQLDMDNKSNDFVYTLTPDDYTNAKIK
jgi:hypothetical protein